MAPTGSQRKIPNEQVLEENTEVRLYLDASMAIGRSHLQYPVRELVDLLPIGPVSVGWHGASELS